MSNDKFGDDRLKKDSGAATRAPRDMADASRVETDGGSLSVAQRRKQLRQDWVQEILPTVTAQPGWHYCWVSTTNSTDPVHKRMQMGYVPVKASEVPGFATSQYKLSGGDFDGCIACNEMLLFKVEETRFNDLMAIYHEDMPAEQEQAIREKVNAAAGVDSMGRNLVSNEGFDRLGKTSHSFA